MAASFQGSAAVFCFAARAVSATRAGFELVGRSVFVVELNLFHFETAAPSGLIPQTILERPLRSRGYFLTAGVMAALTWPWAFLLLEDPLAPAAET